MPEGPEAAYITKFMNNEFINKTLNKVDILKGRYINHGPPAHYNTFVSALPLKLLHVEKKGKVIFIYFENDWCIISKLGMSGWWYSNNKPAWRSEFKSVVFEFNNTNDTLIYSDPRSYGTLTFTQDTNLIRDELEQLAPDIISKSTTVKVFLNKAQLIANKKGYHIENIYFSNNNFALGHSAMQVNEGLPLYLVSKLEEKFDLNNLTIGILGAAFKGESDDIRSSLSYKLKKILQFRAKKVLMTDPYVSVDANLISLEETIEKSDVLIKCSWFFKT